MVRTFTALTVLLTTSAALAETGPQIAYAKKGSRPEIHLINPDNSGGRLLYRGAQRSVIFAIDMKPGGGELSFEEAPCCSSGPSTLKTISYGESGTLGTVTRSLTTCRIGSIDYHPSDGSLLFTDNCTKRIARLAAGSTSASDIGAPASFFANWLSNGLELIYASQGKVWRAPAATPTSAQEVVTLECQGSMDTARLSNRTLVYLCDQQIGDLNVDGKTLTGGFERGSNGRFSPDDQRVLYISPPQRGQSYLLIRATSGQGLPVQINGQASYSSADWRN